MTSFSSASPDAELPRDRWGRPLITPPEGGEPVAYRRVTTFAGALDDSYHLNKWKARMVARGMATAPDLQAGAAAANPQDKSGKRTLDEIAERALERANGTAAATLGTARHSMTEKIDRNEPLGYVPEDARADLDAYRTIMAPFTVLAIEGFCVLDEYRIGGTYDRILDLGGNAKAPDGTFPRIVIGDVKTGGIDFAAGKIGMQLAAYSRSLNYDHRDGSRTPLHPVDEWVGTSPAPTVSQTWGVVIHLPVNTGTASLHWIDLAAGARGLDVARDVLAYRDNARNLLTKFAAVTTAATPPLTIAEQIRNAPSRAALEALWRTHEASWTPGLTSLSLDRVQALEASA